MISHQIQVSEFNDLTNFELYEILKLRNEVFVVEQECPYDDIDGNDINALHLFIIENDSVVACCRILKPGVTFPTFAIGRLATKKEYRGNGYARSLMENAIKNIFERVEVDTIMISAQSYLKEFYDSLGFKIVSDMYLEDEIPHYNMMLKKNKEGR